MLPAMIIQRRQIAFFLWFCFLVFLVVMAAEGKASIYFTAVIYLFFYFIGIDERPAMGSQPNLFSRPEVVSIYKCPPPFWGSSPNLGRKKHQILDHFFRDFRTRHRISPERNVASTNKIGNRQKLESCKSRPL